MLDDEDPFPHTLKGYGAVGDGVADDTVAVRAWIGAIVASRRERPSSGPVPGATMILDEVYTHSHPFQVAQATTWLVGHARTGSFAAGEHIASNMPLGSADIGPDPECQICQNPTWKNFEFGGTMHYESGSGANGATIDLNGMPRSELNLRDFDSCFAPADIGAGGTLATVGDM